MSKKKQKSTSKARITPIWQGILILACGALIFIAYNTFAYSFNSTLIYDIVSILCALLFVVVFLAILKDGIDKNIFLLSLGYSITGCAIEIYMVAHGFEDTDALWLGATVVASLIQNYFVYINAKKFEK